MSCLSPSTLFRFLIAPTSLSFGCQFTLEQTVSHQYAPDLGLYLQLLATTVALETPIYLFAFWLRNKLNRRSMPHILALNLCTHPAVAFLLPIIAAQSHLRYGTYRLTAESFAIGVEALYLNRVMKLSRRDSLLFSFAANLFSWWLGVYLS